MQSNKVIGVASSRQHHKHVSNFLDQVWLKQTATNYHIGKWVWFMGVAWLQL